MLLDLEKIVEVFNIPQTGVFHVGAHHGQEMERYKKLKLKNVVMFEPSPKTFEILQENLKDEEVTLVNLGLASEDSELELYVESANLGQSNSLLKPMLHTSQYPDIKFESKEKVNLTSLDKWCEKNEEKSIANIMSLDVQGYELEVLLGSQKTLKNIDIIICEVNRSELYKDCAFVIEIDIFLRHHGFRRVATNWVGKTWGDAAYVKENFVQSVSKIPSIDIIDKSFSHSKGVLGFDSACLLPTSKFNWNREKTGDFDFVVVTDESVAAKTEKRKIAWLLEPKDISNHAYNYVENHQNDFVGIVSHDINFVQKIENGIYSPFGGTWISPNDWTINTNKKMDVSIIASNKNFTDGHKLRHEAAKLLDVQHRFGRAYKSIDNKIEALRDYRFSIVIENSKSEGYFSEKLIDCLITCTIPIYWGSKSATQIFNKDGIITFETISELKEILESINFEEHYEKAKDAVISNAKKSRRFASVDENFISSVLGLG